MISVFKKLAGALAASLLTLSGPYALAAEAEEFPIRVLLVTGGHPYDEVEFHDMVSSIPNSVITHVELSDHSEIFENIAGWNHDAILFYNMTHELSDHRLNNMMTLTEWGVGMLPLHHSTLSWTPQPEVKQIFGVEFPDAGNFGFQVGQIFTYHIEDRDHPITEVLEDWVVTDETYTNFYGRGIPGNRVLITTEYEPSDDEVAWVRKHNNSRIAVIQGGHDKVQFTHESFQTLVHRSIHWVAGRLADDGEETFETAIYRENYEIPAAIQGIKNYTADSTRRWLIHTENLLQNYREIPAKQSEIIDGLVEVALTSNSSHEARSWALRQVGHYGNREHLKSILPLLKEEKIGHMAVFALGSSPLEEAEGFLLEGMKDAEDEVLVSALLTFGEIAEKDDPRLILKYTQSDNPLVRESAIKALGSIGGPGSVDELLSLRQSADESVRDTIDEALLSALSTESKGRAPSEYGLYEGSASTEMARVAAWKARLLDSPSDEVLFEKALLHEHPEIRDVAITTLPKLDAQNLIGSVSSFFNKLEEKEKIAVLYALGEAKAPSSLTIVHREINSSEPDVAAAAIYTAGTLGNRETAELLLEKYPTAGASEQELITEALTAIPQAEVDGYLIAVVQEGSDNQAMVISLLADRAAVRSIPVLLKLIDSRDRDVKQACYDAIGAMGTDEHIPVLLDQLLQAEEALTMRSISGTIGKLASRSTNEEKILSIYTSKIGKGTERSDVLITNLIGDLKTDDACKYLIMLMHEREDRVQVEAIKALSKWPTIQPREGLLKVAESSDARNVKTLALRGYLSLVSADESLTPWDRLNAVKAIDQSIDDQQAKTQVLDILAKAPTIEALNMLKTYLADESVSQEAVYSIVRCASPLSLEYPEQVNETLSDVLSSDVPDSVKSEAQEAINLLAEFGDRILGNWNFASDAEGWQAQNHAQIEATEGVLTITATGNDPFIGVMTEIPEQPLLIKLRVRYEDDPQIMQFFMRTDRANMGEEGTFLTLTAKPSNGEWLEYEVPFTAPGKLLELRFDPRLSRGTFEVDYIRVMKDTEKAG